MNKQNTSWMPWGVALLAAFHGVLITLMIVFFVNSQYEDGLYDSMLNTVLKSEMTAKEKVITLMHTTHKLLKPRADFFTDGTYINFRDRVFRSADVQLIDARGACGSYAHVLGRLLQRAGFPVRIAQMKCGNTWALGACHILLETKLNGSWVTLDALFDLAFEKDDGSMASFEEVGENWQHYKKQLPENYVQKFSYEGVRYTNWQKIPFLMPALRNMLEVILGEKVKTLSIRSFVLNVYKTYGMMAAVAYVFLIALSLSMIRRARWPQNNQ